MNHTGLLLLTSSLKTALESLGNHLKITSKYVNQKLYVVLQPSKESCVKSLDSFIPTLYDKASSSCKNIDVRLLVRPSVRLFEDRTSEIQVVLTDSKESESSIVNAVKNQFKSSCSNIVRLEALENVESEESEDVKTYNYVVIGGTFDRIHNGHKILLSSAVLRAKKKLIIGVTDGVMLKRKSLWELIKPFDKRKEDLLEYLNDIDSTIEYSAVPLYDIFGPAITHPELECIVVSNETKKGGQLVNDERRKRGMNELDLVVIDLVSDPDPDICDESKISSSNQRRALLGKYLQQPPVIQNDSKIVRIVLIGGSFDIDSSIINQLKNLGAFVVDCDHLFEDFLKPGSKTRSKMCDKFGKDVLDTLCSKLEKREQFYLLSANCWEDEKTHCYLAQIIEYLFENEVESLKSQNSEGHPVCILKLPFFIKMNYLKKNYQIWGILTPESERLQNIRSVLSLDEEAATKVLKRDMSNTDIVASSHLVLSPNCDSTYVAKQVTKAWEQLKLCQSNKRNLPKSSM